MRSLFLHSVSLYMNYSCNSQHYAITYRLQEYSNLTLISANSFVTSGNLCTVGQTCFLFWSFMLYSLYYMYSCTCRWKCQQVKRHELFLTFAFTFWELMNLTLIQNVLYATQMELFLSHRHYRDLDSGPWH